MHVSLPLYTSAAGNYFLIMCCCDYTSLSFNKSGPQEWIDLLLAEPRLLDALQFLCSYTGVAQWADPTAGARKAVAKVCHFLMLRFLLVRSILKQMAFLFRVANYSTFLYDCG